MEGSVSPPVHKQSIRTPRKGAHQSKDIWLVVREGSVSDVDSALSMLKKNGGNINETGLTPLHIATWRNHIPIVQRFLVAGADPNAVKDTVPNAEAQGFNPGLIVLLLVGVLVLVFFIGNYVMYMYAQ